MPRKARITLINYPHIITQKGNNKDNVFFNDEDRKFYLDILKKYSKKYSLDIWGYCLMDNHVHLLCVPKTKESLSKAIGRTSLVYTQHVNNTRDHYGRIWQNRFSSCLVDKDKVMGVMRYIESNPIRAGLIKIAEQYQWSSAKSHILSQKDDLLSDNRIEAINPQEYSLYFYKSDKDMEAKIQKSLSSGQPICSDNRLPELEEAFKK